MSVSQAAGASLVYNKTLVAGSGVTLTETETTVTIDATGGGGGGVTSVAMSVPTFLSVTGSPITTSGTLAVTYSGTALPVANGGSGVTTITGLIKGNGASPFSAAVSGTDYAPPTSGTSILYGDGSGGFSNVTIGANLTFSAGTLSASGGGGGSATWTEVEIDFGNTPIYDAIFTITDASISSTSKVVISPSGKPATGRTADDWQWDGATLSANPGTGTATCYAIFSPGPIVGRRKLQYQIG